MDQEDFNEKFRRRTKMLALEIIKIISPLKIFRYDLNLTKANYKLKHLGGCQF